MARMREPFTGGIFDVPAPKVDKYLGRGYALLDGSVKPVYVDGRGNALLDGSVKPAETPAADADAPKPTADSTIAEIRAWAKTNGVALPKRGNKAQLLEAIG